jgi:hypothetical protein
MEHKSLKYWKNQTPPTTGKKYTDDLFPPNANSLIGKDSSGNFIDKVEGEKRATKIDTKVIGWMRCSDLYKNQKYLLFENKIEKDDINQGILGDCYFLASVAALTEYPNLVYQMFRTKTINKEGFFELIFFIDGEYQIVIVDDYIPIDKRTKKEVYARPNKNEIYVCILEKAWAKINGGYVNIIKGWMHQVLETFTGFPSESYNHTKIRRDFLWSQINFAINHNCILSCSSTKNVESKGLVNSHAYTLIGTYMIKSKGRIIKLVKLRNTWGFGEWNGDWSDKSPLWTEEEKSQVDFVKKDDGTFYMSYEDYFKHFIITDICYVQYESYSKSFKIEGEDIRHGQVFNIYLEEEGFLSAAVIRKMWRFNREYTDTIIPTVLILMRYDPNKEYHCMMSDFEGANNTFEDTSISKNLKSGYYICYTYHDIPHSTKKDETEYFVKFDCGSKFKVRKSKMDDYKEGFPFLKKMIIQDMLGDRVLKQNDKFTSFVSSYKKSGIGHRMVYNNTKKIMKFIESSKDMKNQFILSPYSEDTNDKCEWYIIPGEVDCLLTMELSSKVKSEIGLKAKGTYVSKAPQEEYNEINVQEYANDQVSKDNNSNIEEYYDYITISLEKAKEDLQFAQLDMSSLTKAQIEKKEPAFMKNILTLAAPSNEKDLSWTSIKTKDGKYVGQINKNRKKEGRGIFQTDTNIFLGYFLDNKENGEGMIFDIGLKEIKYKGNFVDGLKKGKGVIYYKNGDKYEGEFDNDVKEGHGIYTFKTGTSWEGPFHDDKMDGEGIFKGKKTRKVIYEKGILKK